MGKLLIVLAVLVVVVVGILVICRPDEPAAPTVRRDRPEPSTAAGDVAPVTESDGGSLTVSVVTTRGEPVPAATVRLIPLPEIESALEALVGEANAEGRSEFTNLPDGAWCLHAHGPDAGSGVIACVPTKAGERIEVEVVLDGESSFVSGTVVDHEDRPVAGVSVRARLPHPFAAVLQAVGRHRPAGQQEQYLDLECETDESGRFRIEGVPPGHVFLLAGGLRHGLAFGRADCPAVDVVLKLPGIGTVQGVVRVLGDERPKSISVSVSPGGRFESYEPSGAETPFEILCVNPGRCLVEVRADGFRDADTKPFEVLALESTDVGTIEIHPETLVSGRITDPDGRPLPGSEIALARIYDSSIHLSGYAAADEEGRYRTRLAPGRWSLEPGCRGYAAPDGKQIEIVVGEESVERDLVLEPIPSIRGRVVDSAGRPVEGVCVFASGPMEARLDHVYLAGRHPGLAPNECPEFDQTAKHGRFVLYGLVEDEVYSLVVTDNGSPLGASVDVCFDDAGRSHPIELRVPATAERPPGTTIIGRVVDEDGRPLAGAAVHLGGSLGITGPDGRYRLEDVRTGGVLCAAAPRHAAVVREGVPEPGPGDHDLGDIILPRTSRIAVNGTVTNSAGIAVRTAIVGATFTLPGGTEVQMRGMTDRDGRYRIAGPDTESIAVTVTVMASGYRHGSEKKATCGPEAFLDFTLKAETKVAGRIGFAGKTPAHLTVRHVRDDGVRGNAGWVRFDPANEKWSIDMAPGTYRFEIDAEGYAPVLTDPITVEAGATTEVPAVRLTPGGTVRGILRNADGSPSAMSDVQVRFFDGYGKIVKTDAEGRFLLEEIPPGRWEIRGWIRKPRKMITDRVPVSEGATAWIDLGL
jgi:protocatechuate 3,4-dioxygenase beta subunit